MQEAESDTAQVIAELVRTMKGKVLRRVLVEDPFIPEEHHSKKPAYAALVPDVIVKDLHFERRFVTPFGTFWERLAQIKQSSWVFADNHFYLFVYYSPGV